MIERQVAQLSHKYVWVNSGVEPANQAAAIERCHHSQKREDRQPDDQRDDTRQNENVDRVEPHGLQGIDLFAHFHGAEFGGIRRPGATRDHDRHDQHADLAHYQNAEHIDHVEASTESAETDDALLRDDRSDQERDQQDDRNGAPAHAVDVMHHGGQTETAGSDQHAQDREYERTEHLEIEQKIARHDAERAPH